MITLRDVLKNVEHRNVIGNIDIQVQGITSDSRKVRKNFIFAAVKGNRFNGYDFIQEALGRGANVIVSEDYMDLIDGCVWVEVDDARIALALFANSFYGNSSAKLNVIGITGTNGKTTVSHMIEAVAKKNGQITGLIGTIEYRFTDYFYRANMTTPEASFIHYLLSKMVDESVDTVIMEVSSHALKQNRVEAIDFDIGVFTNLTSEHLDYHQSIQDYLDCKTKLFSQINRSKNKLAGAVINTDDPCGRYICDKIQKRTITYGIDYPADLTASDILIDLNGSTFTMNYNGKKTLFELKLIGRHNIYNALACIGAGIQMGFAVDDIRNALVNFNGVPGRLQKITTSQPYTVYVDYAHTEDALRQTLRTLRNVHKGKINVVFGCGGNRDALKRPVMGEVACKYADFSVLTSDNPRDEDPMRIIKDIEKGFWKNNYKVISDRREAINYGIVNCNPEDVLLIAGKGHEKYQIIDNCVFSFNDAQVAKSFLYENNYTAL